MAVSNRGGAGGGPQDTARPASVSELVIGETPGDSCGCWFDLSGVGTREPLTEVSVTLGGVLQLFLGPKATRMKIMDQRGMGS